MATLPPSPLPVLPSSPGWRLGRRLLVAGFVVGLVLLLAAPERAPVLFWSGVVPLLPVLFLVHPGLWRNVCPLATLGMGPEGPPGDSGLDSAARACVLLLLLIPLRPLGLESMATASAGLLAVAAGGALLGRRRPRKAGFCNRWCPVLPVERLYGQRPLVELANTRCDACTLCTPRGCLDLSPDAATAQLLGPGRNGAGWVVSPLGAFAAAFPGVVLAFFLLPADPGVLQAYGRILGGGAAAWAGVALVVRLVPVPWRVALPTLGALAAGPYLWFALPGAARAWGLLLPDAPVGAAGITLVAGWWLHAVASRRIRAPRPQT